MFYDVDLLSRRGGKFCVIWLVANQKLRLKGIGSKKDLRLVLEVRIDRICQEIMKNVRFENPGRLSTHSYPRFSLYLSAMLTHGAVLIHHRQVTHIIAHFLLTYYQRKIEKNFNELNISCSSPDLTDVACGAEENLLGDTLTLEEREFGQLVDVVDALRISPFHDSPPQGLPEAPFLLNQTTSVDEIEKDFAEFFKQTSQSPYRNFAAPEEITMREEEPVDRVLPEMTDESFGVLPEGIESIPEWGNNDLPAVIEPMEVDDPSGAGRPSLQRSNSKRVHDGCSVQEDVPSKQSRIDQPGEPVSAHTSAANHAMDLILEPLQDSPIRAMRRRRRRLIIDAQTSIPGEIIQAQLRNYQDTQRVADAINDITIPQYAESTVNHLFRRPGVPNVKSPLRNLITRNMITRELDDSHFDIPFTETIRMENNTQNETRVASVPGVGSPSQISAPPKTPTNEKHDEIPMVHPLENVNNTVENIPFMDNLEDVERARAGQSNEASLILSLNASNLTIRDNSGLEISRTSPAERQIGRNPCMDTLVEASVENSRGTKSSVNEDWNRRTASNEKTLIDSAKATVTEQTRSPRPSKSLSVIAEKETDSSVRADGELPIPEHAPQTSVDDQVLRTPNRQEKFCGSPIRPMTKCCESPYSPVEIPEDSDLLSMIDALTDEISNTVTFRELVPTSSYSNIEAAKIFCRLLVLKKERQIGMRQKLTGLLPYEDIYITMRNR
ncbi:hypothetical protein GHT06_013069 [Daphnia sinensis]|uniref:Rad21/Rec8-like protein N-terminal domain-containing protein n=1 Tax=Daphnia sinensis TaxID=1820382 RepID=A0AAD5KYR8_9CRUS|nr:hypothetical protein GHT06_013069 [Daphnia sinensis]